MGDKLIYTGFGIFMKFNKHPCPGGQRRKLVVTRFGKTYFSQVVWDVLETWKRQRIHAIKLVSFMLGIIQLCLDIIILFGTVYWFFKFLQNDIQSPYISN